MSKYDDKSTAHLQKCLGIFSQFDMLAPTCKKIRKELKRRKKT